MDDIYEKIDKYNLNEKCKILIALDGMIANMIINNEIQVTVTELFVRNRKTKISLVVITKFYFSVPKMLG